MSLSDAQFQQLLAKLERLADEPIDQLRYEAATDIISKEDIKAELRGMTRGQLIRRIIEQDYP